MDKDVEILNRRLGNGLGFVLGGSKSRFAWIWAPDVQYYYRPNVTAPYEKVSWAERLGKVWVLCQWRPPLISPDDWWTSFHGQFPYPTHGMYYAHGEVSVPVGRKPTMSDTIQVIRRIDEQETTTIQQHYNNIQADLAAEAEQKDEQWADQINDMAPAFDVWNSGKKSGVEFQVPGLKQ